MWEEEEIEEEKPNCRCVQRVGPRATVSVLHEAPSRSYEVVYPLTAVFHNSATLIFSMLYVSLLLFPNGIKFPIMLISISLLKSGETSAEKLCGAHKAHTEARLSIRTWTAFLKCLLPEWPRMPSGQQAVQHVPHKQGGSTRGNGGTSVTEGPMIGGKVIRHPCTHGQPRFPQEASPVVALVPATEEQLPLTREPG